MMSNIIKTLAVVMIVLTCQVQAQPIITDSTSRSETTVKSPPPTAIAPAVTSMNNDLCTVGASGAVQTQILGLSFGQTSRDLNCERLKLSKNLFDMGMKVAAVSLLCQDERVFTAMMDAGTPCPVEGRIGDEARAIWQQRASAKIPPRPESKPETTPEVRTPDAEVPKTPWRGPRK
jgi:hypothetical protein